MRPGGWLVVVAVVATGITLVPDSVLAGGKPRAVGRAVTSPGVAGGAFSSSFSAPPTLGTFSPPHSPFVSGRAFRAPHHFRSHPGVFHKFTTPHKFGFPHRALRAPIVVGALPSTVVAVVSVPEPIVPYVAPVPVAYPPQHTVPVPRDTVIQYPHGRYELRGDGVTTPYVWVWIPNPPLPPPPPSAEPAPPPGPPAAAPAPPERRTVIHRWTDERGVTHFTDDRENVPEGYRDQLQRPAPPPGPDS